MGIKCKLVEKSGERFYTRVFWGKNAHEREYGIHNAMLMIRDFYGREIDFPLEEIKTLAQFDRYQGHGFTIPLTWPQTCEQCQTATPPFKEGVNPWAYQEDVTVAVYQYFFKTLYDSPARLLQAGDMFWATWMGTELDPRGHLAIVCPGYDENNRHMIWDTMSEATNCTHAEKGKSHYCWTRVGEPPNCSITPSILIGNYHGFVTNGEFNP